MCAFCMARIKRQCLSCLPPSPTSCTAASTARTAPYLSKGQHPQPLACTTTKCKSHSCRSTCTPRLPALPWRPGHGHAAFHFLGAGSLSGHCITACLRAMHPPILYHLNFAVRCRSPAGEAASFGACPPCSLHGRAPVMAPASTSTSQGRAAPGPRQHPAVPGPGSTRQHLCRANARRQRGPGSTQWYQCQPLAAQQQQAVPSPGLGRRHYRI